MSYTIAIAALLGLIFVHELGHFLVAKAVGARATKFYVGFPPAILRARRGDTEYGIGAIPLGGYVRIVGMTRPQAVDLWRVIDAVDEAALRRPADETDTLGPATERLRTLLASGRLADASAAVPAVVTSLDADRALLLDRTYAQAAKDLRRMGEELDPRAYWGLAVWRRIAIILAGPAANLVAAVALFFVFFTGGVPIYSATTTIDQVGANTPAATAGVLPGDQIVAIGPTAITARADLGPAIQASHGQPIAITVERAGQRVVLPAVAPYQPNGPTYMIGVTPRVERTGTTRYGSLEAARRAFGETWSVTTATVSAIANLVTPKGREGVSSAVGMTEAASQSVGQGYFSYLVALISLSLAIFNLLPFLPLDGGHILFSVIEKLRGGRPVPRVVFERVSMLGIALVLVLVAIGLNNDITRFTSP